MKRTAAIAADSNVRHFPSHSLSRKNPMTKVVTTFVAVLGAIIAASAFAVQNDTAKAEVVQQAEADNQTAAQKERTEALYKWTRKYAQDTHITVLNKGDGEAAELRAEPVMRYSDQPRFIADATLWVWSLRGRPVAIQKVEVNDTTATPLWTVCFAALSEELVEAKWPFGQTFKTTKPGCVFEAIPSADPPAEKAAVRTLQMRALSRRFSGSVYSSVQNSNIPMRLLPKPVYEYSDPETTLPLGAIFGLADNGTNPAVFVVIEARPNKDGTLAWHHAHSRMTADIGKMSFDETTIWEFKPVNVPNDPSTNFDNWMYYFMRRNLTTLR